MGTRPKCAPQYALDRALHRTRVRIAHSHTVAAPAQSQWPMWFCSHWWGEPVLDFFDCIQTHAVDREYGCFKTKNGKEVGLTSRSAWERAPEGTWISGCSAAVPVCYWVCAVR